MHFLRFFLLSCLFIYFPLFSSETSDRFRYSYVPKQTYAGQVFPITVLMNSEKKENNNISFTFDPVSHIRPLNPDPLIVRNGQNIFYTFYFKASNEDIVIPELMINDHGRMYVFKKVLVSVSELKPKKEDNFCGVIASGFHIKTSQVSTFDDRNNLVYISIEAHEANLEDMKIPGVLEGGVEKINRRYAKAESEYYFVVPSNQKEIRFSYYDSIKKQFVPVVVSTSYKQKEIAAQVDLNPKDSSFLLIKKYTFGILSLFFLIMFIVQRDIFYLILLAITMVAFLTFFTPHKKICVQEGTPLYILPFSGSSIGTHIDTKKDMPVLNEYGKYFKIIYKDGMTGWVKDEDLCKD